MWKVSSEFYGVALMALFAEVCVACKVGIFDNCNKDKPPILEETAPPRARDFLYFQNAGDIETMTTASENWLMRIAFINGSVIRQNHDDFIEIQGTHNESVTVNMRTLAVTVYALDGVGKMIITLNITKYVTSIANETLSAKSVEDKFLSLVTTNVNDKNEVTIHTSCALIVFYVKWHVGQTVHIQRQQIRVFAPQNTAVYERRDSDEVYFIHNGGNVWEEMYIQPTDVHIRAKNHLGTLDFRRNQPIVVNEWNGTRVSASPFGQKFGRIAEKNVTRQLTFDADGCGTLDVDGRSSGRRLIASARPQMLSIIDHDKKLKIVPRDYILANSNRGIIKVDFQKNEIQIVDIADGSISTCRTSATERKKCAGAVGSVEHFPEGFVGKYRYKKPRSPFTWKMNVELGSIDFPTSESMQDFRFVSADAAIANVTLSDDGFEAKDTAGTMFASCDYAKLTGSGGQVVEMRGNVSNLGTFVLRNAPGSVKMGYNSVFMRSQFVEIKMWSIL